MKAEEYKTINLEVKPIYKIPEGYHVDVSGDTLMLMKDPWVPKEGETYYEPMDVQYKPVPKVCRYYDTFKGKIVFKTLKECRDWCKWKNSAKKAYYNQLMEQEQERKEANQ